MQNAVTASEERAIERRAQATFDLLDVIWRTLASAWTVRVLLAILALLLGLGQAIPQLPRGVAGDPGALARWTAGAPAGFQNHIGWMQATGLLNLYSAIGMRLLLGITMLAILVSAVDGVLSIRRFMRDETAFPPGTVHEQGEWKLSGVELQSVVAGLREDMLARRYIVQSRGGEGQTTLRAVRWPAFALIYLGLLVLLFAFVLRIGLGWEATGLAMPPGEVQSLGHGKYAVTLEQGRLVTPPVNENVELFSLFHADVLLMRGLLSAEQPLHYRNFRISQQAVGSLVTVRGESERGEPLRLVSHPRSAESSESLNLAFAPGQTESYFRSVESGQTYVVRLSGDALEVDVYGRGDVAPAWSRVLEGDDRITFGEERLSFSPGHYVVLDVRSDPAQGASVGGGLLALVGAVLLPVCRPSRLVWRVQPVRTAVRVEYQGTEPLDTLTWPALEGGSARRSQARGGGR